jgi:hypothetical protein
MKKDIRDIRIEVFAEGDEKEILRLLLQVKLPIEDLTIDKLKNFLVARREDGPHSRRFFQ